jgi:hypothetical protein
MLLTPNRFPRCTILIVALLHVPIVAASASHDAGFWKAIREHNFAVPEHQSVGALVLEIADLAAETDPTLRDEWGYEILAAWNYRDNLLSGEQLEALRRKLLPAMISHVGESENDTIFGRSFSALYMSILAAQDLRKPFYRPPLSRKRLILRCDATPVKKISEDMSPTMAGRTPRPMSPIS